MSRPDRLLEGGRISTYRHPLLVRLTHWVNAACLLVLLTSGLQIFNAHPALYLGDRSTFASPILAVQARETADFDIRGVTVVLGRAFDTTGLLGAFEEGGARVARAFPRWTTLPPNQDLATGRRWHFFFAWAFALNGALYLGHGVASGRLRGALIPTVAEIRGLGRSLGDHLRLRFPRGEDARRYNGLQKLSYVLVLLGLAPLMVATGLAMSPGLNAAFPWLPELFGGRQSARTFHFLAAAALVLFALVHVAMVLLSGAANGIASMITGRYVIRPEKTP